jgi:hypothetical protein
MKKTYQTPTAQPSDMELEQLIAASPLITTNGENLEQDLSNPETTGATSGNLSRFSIWGDDDPGEEY